MTLQSKRTSLNEKLEIYRATSARYQEWYGDQQGHGGSCFYWSLTLMGVLMEHGYRPLIQAGSMSWPIVPPGQDDGCQFAGKTSQEFAGENHPPLR
jgi:hypothetical protein